LYQQQDRLNVGLLPLIHKFIGYSEIDPSLSGICNAAQKYHRCRVGKQMKLIGSYKFFELQIQQYSKAALQMPLSLGPPVAGSLSWFI